MSLRDSTILQKKIGLQIGIFLQITVKKFINTGKNKLDQMFHNNVVYKILCSDCEATYVGLRNSLIPALRSIKEVDR